MSWIFLIMAGIFEMVGVLMLIAGFGLSFWLLSLAMETLPMGTAYAVWTGIGASGGAILGMIFYGEPRNTLRIVFITMVLGSAVGLKLVS